MIYGDSPAHRVALSTSVGIAIYMTTSIILIRQKEKSKLKSIIAYSLVIFCIILAFRIIESLSSDKYTGLLYASIAQSLTNYALVALMLVGGIGFLLLLKQKLDKELLESATTDYLTGINNRRSFVDKTRSIMNLCVRNNKYVSMFAIDIDNFKNVNDKFGHIRGDTVLKELSSTVKNLIRPYDVFGRVGGEEFSVTLFDAANDALLIAERIRASVERLVFKDVEGLNITVSIGVCSLIPTSENDIEYLMHCSDKALYEAKALLSG